MHNSVQFLRFAIGIHESIHFRMKTEASHKSTNPLFMRSGFPGGFVLTGIPTEGLSSNAALALHVSFQACRLWEKVGTGSNDCVRDTCMKDPNWIPRLTLAWLSPALSMHLSSESIHKNSLSFLLLLKYIKNKMLSLNISSPKKKYKVKSQIWSMPGLQNRKQKAHS